MKKRSRIFAMLIALAMVFTYMPALAFADETEEASPTEVVESSDYFDSIDKATTDSVKVDEPTLEVDSNKALFDPEDAIAITSITFEPIDVNEAWCYDPVYFNDGDQLTVHYSDNSSIKFTFTEESGWEDHEEDSASLYGYEIYANYDEEAARDNCLVPFNVELLAFDDDDNYQSYTASGFKALYHDYYYHVMIDGLRYELDDYGSTVAGVWDYKYNGVPSTVTIRDSVTLADGKTYPVTTISTMLPKNVTAVHVPASVTNIRENTLGYCYDETTGERIKTPGFTVFAPTGSVAFNYAAGLGITARDLVAEAEAYRQGTLGAGMQKLKMSKPAAKKNAITVKWKKLTKKQLKKSKATHYEIWVSTDPSFPSGATKEKIVKKSKASWKCTGLKKNTKYYVRVRTLKYVNGQKVTGKWSQKTIKTKKK